MQFVGSNNMDMSNRNSRRVKQNQMSLKGIHAVMLAAGVGRRLNIFYDNQQPKCLLEFEGKTLLHRHVEILIASKVKSLTIIVGFKSKEIADEIDHIQANDFVDFIYNNEFERGSVISLWCASDKLRSGNSILFMDSDVLYHRHLIERLTVKTNRSIIPYDLHFEDGDEPVKLCLKNKKPVEFGKIVNCNYDVIGEWPGFIRLSPKMANLIANDLDMRISQQDLDSPCEAAIRQVMLESTPKEFNFIDISGIPWIEIDFPEDVKIAHSTILPAINSFST